MRVLGKYRLLELLASGGMADVWRAELTGAAGVTKEVAVKLVRGEHEASSEFVRMFVEEARLASRLGHANVVQVFEFGLVEGRYHIAMELVRGHHLGRVVERARERGVRLGLPRAVHAGAEIAKGLAHAHRNGCVHRDVSPHNVLVSFEGEVKLADFGIARAMGQAGLTAPGTVKGKAAYMAPEQARGQEVDARADLFALGVILWELCTGRRLFARESEFATFEALTSSDPISPPSAWNEAVPPRLDAAIMALLARDPAARTATADEAVAALSGVLLELARSHDDVDLRAFMARVFPEGPSPASASEPTRVRAEPAPAEVGGPAALGGAAPGEESAEAPTRTAPATRRARTWRAAGAVAAAALLAAGGWAVLRRGGGEAPTGAVPAPAAPALAAPPVAPPSSPAQAPSPAPAAAEAPPATERPPARSTAAPPRRPLAIVAKADQINGLPTPPASSGEGILTVTATPWAEVSVDGRHVSDSTPVELQLPVGEYRVTLQNRAFATASVVVRVSAGARASVHRNLAPRR